MFSHVTVGTNDMDKGAEFYSAIFEPLGIALLHREEMLARYGRAGEELPFFTVLSPADDALATTGNGTMVAFVADTRESLRAVHAAALRMGGRCEGPPGLRPQYGATYYGAYFRDPDGNKLHVVCRAAEEGD